MGYQVLIVEDNEPAINMMVDMLLTMRITNITKASNGKSALSKIQFQKFDLIICDLNMPIMGGLEFFQNAKQSEFISNTPFLMVSAENEKNKIVKALDLGISDYLVKPFSLAMFSTKVKKVLKISTEIHWSEDLALGNETLDNDHKYLIILVNAIGLAMSCNISCDEMLTHLSLLETHCKNHFQREEDIMVKIGSPELAFHRSHHQSMLNQLRELYEDIKSKVSTEECRETIPFVELLSGWIIRDVLDQDKKIKEYFIKVNKAQLQSKPPEVWKDAEL